MNTVITLFVLLDLKNLNTTGFIIKLPPFFSHKKLFSAVLFNLAPKISKDLKIHKIVKYSYKTIGVWVSFARTQFNKCVLEPTEFDPGKFSQN